MYNNEWNTAGSPAPDKICGSSPSDWEVISNQRANNTTVLTYPSVQQNYSPNVTISSMSKLTSTYAENMHATSGTDAEAAYDLRTTDNAHEIMFWVDNHGQTPAGSQVATVSFGGSTWHLYVGASTDSFVLDHNAESGTVDLCWPGRGTWRITTGTCLSRHSSSRPASGGKSALPAVHLKRSMWTRTHWHHDRPEQFVMLADAARDAAVKVGALLAE